MNTDCYDIIIIGGGPAGAAMGCYIAKEGLRCLVIEKDIFPRPHVGESFVPSSTRVFKELGFLAKMEEAGFPRKYGAAWTSPQMRKDVDQDAPTDTPFKLNWRDLVTASSNEGPSADIAFNERKQDGVDQDYTYHVNREIFDAMLLRHAKELGADVLQGIAVRDVRFTAEGGVEVDADVTGQSATFRGRAVVDASGRRCVLGRKLGLYQKDAVYDQFAVFSWFENLDRGATSGERGDYIYVHFLPTSNSWVWQIPISDRITSIGVVSQKARFKEYSGDHEQFFWTSVETRSDLCAKLRSAKRIRPFSVEADYSYSMENICGDRYVLIGDAARFVDPIFSTGVSIALNSARFASRDLIAALRAGKTVDAESLSTYRATIRRGMRNWYEFISLYYRLNIVFTAFVQDPRYRLDVLKLLQGDVYDEEEPEVLIKMREIVSAVENNPKHGLHRLLGTLRADTQNANF